MKSALVVAFLICLFALLSAEASVILSANKAKSTKNGKDSSSQNEKTTKASKASSKKPKKSKQNGESDDSSSSSEEDDTDDPGTEESADPGDACKEGWVISVGGNVNCVGGNFCYDSNSEVCTLDCNEPQPPGACEDTKCCDVCPCCDGCEPKPDKCLAEELTNCICDPPECCATFGCDDDSAQDDEPDVITEAAKNPCKEDWAMFGENVNCEGGSLCHERNPALCRLECHEASSPACDKGDEKCCDACPCCDGCPNVGSIDCPADNILTCTCFPSYCCETVGCSERDVRRSLRGLGAFL